MFKIGDEVTLKEQFKKNTKNPYTYCEYGIFYKVAAISKDGLNMNVINNRKENGLDYKVNDFCLRSSDFSKELSIVKLMDNNTINTHASIFSLNLRVELIQHDIDSGKPSIESSKIDKLLDKHNTFTWMEAFYLEKEVITISIEELKKQHPEYIEWVSLTEIFQNAMESYAVKCNPEEITFIDFMKVESVKNRIESKKENDENYF